MRSIIGRLPRVLLATAALLAATAATAAGTAPAGAQASGATTDDAGIEKAAAIVQPATVRLLITWEAYVDTGADLGKVGPYELSFMCSGFGVDPSGYIVTAGHCVDPSLYGVGGDVLDQLLTDMYDAGLLSAAALNDESFLQYVVANWKVEGLAADTPADVTVEVYHGIALSGNETAKGALARIVEANPLNMSDVALIKVEAKDLPSLLLADDSGLSVGNSVLSVGYPGSSDDVTDPTMTATFKDGRINSKKTRSGGSLPVYEISAAMSGGMSGGPTVLPDGRVVGVNSFGPVGEPQPFNFLSPVSLIKETLTRNGVKNEISPVNQTYREGVDAYFAGRYRLSIEKFDAVLARVPSYQQAQELKVKALEKAPAEVVAAPAVAPATAASGSSVLPLLIAGALVLAVLVSGTLVALVVLRSRRRAAPAPPYPPVGPSEPTPGVPGVPAPTVRTAPAAPESPPATVSAAPAGPSPVASSPLPAPASVGVNSTTAVSPAPVAMVSQSLGNAQVPDAFCSSCGNHVTVEDRFCKRCGHNLHPEA